MLSLQVPFFWTPRVSCSQLLVSLAPEFPSLALICPLHGLMEVRVQRVSMLLSQGRWASVKDDCGLQYSGHHGGLRGHPGQCSCAHSLEPSSPSWLGEMMVAAFCLVLHSYFFPFLIILLLVSRWFLSFLFLLPMWQVQGAQIALRHPRTGRLPAPSLLAVRVG
jgi:hypothetical protein